MAVTVDINGVLLHTGIMKKPIPGFENYTVDEMGTVRNGNYTKIPQKHRQGYLFVALWKDNQFQQFLVHRLVAQAFIPNPDQLPTVNHLNGDKADNRLENLEWASWSRQWHHGVEIGQRSVAPHVRRVVNAETGEEYESVTWAAKQLGVGRTALNAKLAGQNQNDTPLRYADEHLD